jgi:CheY-like chemotaxis protein
MLCTKEKLLIVDDEPEIRTSMSLLLAEIGYQVRSAEDGPSALRQIREESPEILLSDLNMPGMSGFELLSVVRRRFPAILVIAMSGSFSGNEVPSGVAADAFYQKGSSALALLQLLTTPPRMNRHALQPFGAWSPHWIQVNESRSSTEGCVTIACPECRRTFTQALDGFGSRSCKLECIYCGNSIEHSTVEPSSQIRLQPSQHRPSAATHTQNALAIGD